MPFEQMGAVLHARQPLADLHGTIRYVKELKKWGLV